jgi:uncharacterized protein YcsI (UPF0317 family)
MMLRRHSQHEPVAVNHSRTHSILGFEAGPLQAEMIEALRRGGIHPDHQQVKPAVRIKIRHGKCHSESVRLIDPSTRDIREMAPPVVRVNVQASEIAHYGQIQITIAI